MENSLNSKVHFQSPEDEARFLIEFRFYELTFLPLFQFEWLRLSCWIDLPCIEDLHSELAMNFYIYYLLNLLKVLFSFYNKGLTWDLYINTAVFWEKIACPFLRMLSESDFTLSIGLAIISQRTADVSPYGTFSLLRVRLSLGHILAP